MKRRLSIGAAAVLLLGALGANAGVREVAASPSIATVKTAFNKTLKKAILVDGAGRTLYMFTSESNGKDTICTPQGPYGAECPAICEIEDLRFREGVSIRRLAIGRRGPQGL